VQERLRQLAKATFDGVENRFRNDPVFSLMGVEALAWSNADAQIQDLIECVWAASPMTSDDHYPEARALAEELTARRKNTRNFAPSAWGANVPKSSLDGQRESVIPEEIYDDMAVGRLERLRTVYDVRPGERLCGVGLLKRHGRRLDNRVFSTSHVAALPLLTAWNRAEADVDPW
jgi:CRISPR-associated protein Cmr2